MNNWVNYTISSDWKRLLLWLSRLFDLEVKYRYEPCSSHKYNLKEFRGPHLCPQYLVGAMHTLSQSTSAWLTRSKNIYHTMHYRSKCCYFTCKVIRHSCIFLCNTAISGNCCHIMSTLPLRMLCKGLFLRPQTENGATTRALVDKSSTVLRLCNAAGLRLGFCLDGKRERPLRYFKHIRFQIRKEGVKTHCQKFCTDR